MSTAGSHIKQQNVHICIQSLSDGEDQIDRWFVRLDTSLQVLTVILWLIRLISV